MRLVRRLPTGQDEAYYSTLCSISATVLAILIAFMSACFVYSKQKQDELCINIKKDLQSLNTLFYKFGSLSARERLYWERPETNWLMLMLVPETWDKSPDDLFKKYEEEVKNQYKKDLEEIRDWSERMGGSYDYGVGTHAFFHTRHMIGDIMRRIYCELPCPPGIFRRTEHGSYLESFIRDDFPICGEDFEKWAEKFAQFNSSALGMFYNLQPIFKSIRIADEKRAKSQLEKLKDLKRIANLDGRVKEIYEDNITLSQQDSEYYDTYFLTLSSIGVVTQNVSQLMKYYNRLSKIYPSWKNAYIYYLCLGLFFGVVCPLLKLSNYVLTLNIPILTKNLQIFVTTGFLVCIVLSIISFLSTFLTPITS